MSALKFPGIKLNPGETRISIDEFRRQTTGKKGGSLKKGRNGKYNATVIESEYGRFDSKMEYNRFLELKIMERSGIITGLEKQVRFPLEAGGILISTYIADFVYYEKSVMVVEDSKGFKTREYLMKKKLMKKIHNIDILETGFSQKNNKKKNGVVK